MRTELEPIAKQVLVGALEDAGQTTLEQQVVAPDPQRIDLWHVPGPRPAAPRWPALLYRRTERPCLLEPFSAPPRVAQLRGNQRKQLVWHHPLVLEARPQGTQPPELPCLWPVSPGRPEGLWGAYPLKARAGWPAGFHEVAGSWEIGLLVVPELPAGWRRWCCGCWATTAAGARRCGRSAASGRGRRPGRCAASSPRRGRAWPGIRR